MYTEERVKDLTSRILDFLALEVEVDVEKEDKLFNIVLREVEHLNQLSYDDGYEVGQDEGYSNGYSDGQKEGYDEGSQTAYDECYQNGWDEGRQDLIGSSSRSPQEWL